MISKMPKYLGSTGVGQLYNQRDKLGIVKAGNNLNKTLVGGAADSDEVKKAAKKTGAAEAASKGLQNIKDDYSGSKTKAPSNGRWTG
tara:strand:- start:145 stop:405 length:261 start_codon:yes stop_codon:yes gene_type:complete